MLLFQMHLFPKYCSYVSDSDMIYTPKKINHEEQTLTMTLKVNGQICRASLIFRSWCVSTVHHILEDTCSYYILNRTC